ncbi:MAG: PAS domain-containing protein [Hydrogenophaga sp.]|uniref:PAS domain-containing protein n=1 Tax=Hydrogenophaga sp. TaxID=1904254 RepID=UPI001DA64738|nr:PAS domain-containing protein [Hydrogenophaga sp.]MBX3611806.1 PAS domain-containing protein [Hydrogenophaga sp.]
MKRGATSAPVGARDDAERRSWVEQIDGPAVLVRAAPWRLNGNAAFEHLLSLSEQKPGAFVKAFEAAGFDLIALMAAGQAFEGRMRTGNPRSRVGQRLLQAAFVPLEGCEDWLCTFVDVSAVENRRSRRALVLERLYQTLDRLDEPISLIDHDDTVHYINAAYASFFGAAQPRTSGLPLREVMGDENYERTRASREELFSTL